jgi:hypothetical protein
MFRTTGSFCLLVLAAGLISVQREARAVYPAISIDETAQTADLIFTGTVYDQENVTSGTTASTEVFFNNVKTINASPRSLQKNHATVKLIYAGGEVGGGFVSVSGTPSFETGHSYCVFMLDDGKLYMNPIVGGPQGLFELVPDDKTTATYITAPGGKSVNSVDAEGRPQLSSTKLAFIENGAATYSAPVPSANQPQTAVSNKGDRSPGFVNSGLSSISAHPMTLDDFTDYIKNHALKTRLKERHLKTGNSGKFYRMKDGHPAASDLKEASPAAFPRIETTTGTTSDAQAWDPSHPQVSFGQALTACGTHDLSLVMEQVPSGWSEHSMIDDCLAQHNQFMNIYLTTASDGTFGNNSQNEFGGYASNSTLSGIYGTFNWGGALGVTFTYRASAATCAKITQSDIFWNPAYSYSDDPAIWFNNSSVYNIRATTIPEIGHGWGYQTASAEQYNYDDPSIMHAVYSNVYETGYGLHAKDAGIFRANYSALTSIRNIKDLGVESYYASNGLNNSSLSASTVVRGGSISINDVTVENMSNTSTANVRLRFYLSNKRDFSGTYYQIGSDWTFPSLGAQSYTRNSYANQTIPSNTPTGTYYLLAYVDTSNGSTDDFGGNNTTVFSSQVVVGAPAIFETPSSLSWSINEGQNASSKQFYIQNTSLGTLNYSLSVNYGSGQTGWLSVSPSSGSSTGEIDSVDVSGATSNLPPGTYNATITISDSTATNSGQTVGVTVNIAALPRLSLSPSSITRFITPGQIASSDVIELWNSGNSFSLGYSISDDVNWLQVNPSTGSSNGVHQYHSVQYSTSGLPNGTYYGTISISSPGAKYALSSVIVTMNVAPPAKVDDWSMY